MYLILAIAVVVIYYGQRVNNYGDTRSCTGICYHCDLKTVSPTVSAIKNNDCAKTVKGGSVVGRGSSRG